MKTSYLTLSVNGSRLVSILLMAALLGSCKVETQKQKPYDLSMHWQKEEDFPLSEIASSLEYIPLETCEDCYIPRAFTCKFKVSDRHIFVVPTAQRIMEKAT